MATSAEPLAREAKAHERPRSTHDPRQDATSRVMAGKNKTRAGGTMPNRRAQSSRAARVGRLDVEKCVDRLARSTAEIEVAIRRAEGNIEAHARERIHALRNEARRQLAVLRGHQREASRLLWQLSTAAEGSWDDLKRAAERKLTQARAVVDSMLERFGRAVPRAPRASARPESLFAITPSGG